MLNKSRITKMLDIKHITLRAIALSLSNQGQKFNLSWINKFY